MEERALCKESEEQKKKKRGRRGCRARQIEAQQDEGRRWKRARHQERHKDTGPLRYTAKLHPTQPEKPHRNLHTRPPHELIIQKTWSSGRHFPHDALTHAAALQSQKLRHEANAHARFYCTAAVAASFNSASYPDAEEKGYESGSE